MAEATLHPAETPAARPWYRRRLWLWPLLLICLLVVYYVGGMLGCTRLTTILIRPAKLGAGRRQPGGGGRRRPDRSRDQRPSLGGERPLPPRQPARQHAGVPAGHRRGDLALHPRAHRPGRPHARDEPGRCGSRSSHGPAPLPRHHLDVRFRTRGRRPPAPSSSTARRWRRCAATTSASARVRPCSRPVPTTCSARSTGSPPTSPVGHAGPSIRAAGIWPDFAADNLFYATKGRLYAYYLLMRALQVDFANVIRERQLGNAWSQTVESFREAGPAAG